MFLESHQYQERILPHGSRRSHQTLGCWCHSIPASSSCPGWEDRESTPAGIVDMHEINVLAEHFKWRLMLRQLWDSMLRQTLPVHIASDTKDSVFRSPKWRCALWRYLISHLLSYQRWFRWSISRVLSIIIFVINNAIVVNKSALDLMVDL